MSRLPLHAALRFLVLVVAVSPSWGFAQDAVLARVGGQTITGRHVAAAEAAAKVANRSGLPDDLDLRRAQLLDRAIAARIGSLAAQAAGMDKPPAMVRRLAYLGQKTLHDAYLDSRVAAEVTPDRVRRRFEADNAIEKRQSAQLRQILLANQAEADRAMTRLRRGDPFAKVATDMSRDAASKGQGGDIGQMRREDLPAAVAAAAFGLEPNGISAPVRGPAGWYIVQLVELRVDAPSKFEDSRDGIEQELGDAVRKATVDEASGPAKLVRAPADPQAAAGPNRVAAYLDGAPLTDGELDLAGSDPTVSASGGTPAEQRDNLIQTVAVHRLLAARARQAGIDKTPDFDASLTFGRDSLLSEELLVREVDPTVTDAAIRNFHEREFERPQIRLRSLQMTEAAAARFALARLRRGEPMARVAVAPDVKAAMSFFNEGEEFETIAEQPASLQAALGPLKPNEISGVVRQGTLLSIYQVIGRRSKPPLPEVADDIRMLLIREARAEAILSLGNELGVQRLD